MIDSLAHKRYSPKLTSAVLGTLTAMVVLCAPLAHAQRHSRPYSDPQRTDERTPSRHSSDGRYYDYDDYLQDSIDQYRRQTFRDRYRSDPRVWEDHFPWIRNSSVSSAMQEGKVYHPQAEADDLLDRLSGGRRPSQNPEKTSPSSGNSSDSLGTQDHVGASGYGYASGYPEALRDIYSAVPEDMREIAASAITSSGLGNLFDSQGELQSSASGVARHDPRALEAIGKILSVYASAQAPQGRSAQWEVAHLPLIHRARWNGLDAGYRLNIQPDARTGFVDVYLQPDMSLGRRYRDSDHPIGPNGR